jgi:tetratricopeptide (TPR) repeat protein
MLVVLDNVVDARQVTPLLPASSLCSVIITSRNALSGLAIRQGQRVTLRPLSEASSITLLQNVIGHERTTAESDAVRTLARRCGHLPLALLIAAERVATHPHHSVTELVEELALETQRLDVLAPDDSIAVRTTFSWSYSDLSADSALMFRMLGLHSGPHITVGAAAALIQQPVSRTRRLLDRLTRVHLVDGLGSDRYRMHDLVQVYATERVTAEHRERDRKDAVRRMLDWYLHNAYAANKAISPQRQDPQLDDPDPAIDITRFDFAQAVSWCEGEMSNIVLATQLAVEIGANKLAWQLPVGCFNYLNLRRFNYLHQRKGLSPWVVSHEAGVRGARNGNDKFGEAWALTNLAIAYRELGRLKESHDGFQLALAIREEIGDQVGRAWTLVGIGMLESARNNRLEAVRTLDRAVTAFNAVENSGGESITLAIMGDCYRQLGKFDLALTCLQNSLTLAYNLSDRNTTVSALRALGNTYSDLRSATDALQCYERALVLQRNIGDRWGEAATLHQCFLMLREIGATSRAQESLRMALSIFEEIGDPRSTDLRAQLDS